MSNLIAIAGNTGSGKDTVGSIIQYLMTYPTSLNKTDNINRSYNSFIMDVGMGSKPTWQIKKFAFKLKQIASLLTGVPIEKFEDQEFKKTEMPEEWNYLKQMFECDENNQDGYSIMPMTYRKFLQKLGTEAIRSGLHVNTWVNALFADYKSHWVGKLPVDEKEIFPSWIITDLRFPNEFEAVKERNGICIKINRFESLTPRFTSNDGLQSAQFIEMDMSKEHPSETALAKHQFDYVLSNHGSIDELVEEVRKMLIHFKIIT